MRWASVGASLGVCWSAYAQADAGDVAALVVDPSAALIVELLVSLGPVGILAAAVWVVARQWQPTIRVVLVHDETSELAELRTEILALRREVRPPTETSSDR